MEAEHTFVALCERDVALWNSMLSVYVEKGQGHEALQLYNFMQKLNVIIDETTLMYVLPACLDIESFGCRKVRFVTVSVRLEQNLVLAAALIHAYRGWQA